MKNPQEVSKAVLVRRLILETLGTRTGNAHLDEGLARLEVLLSGNLLVDDRDGASLLMEDGGLCLGGDVELLLTWVDSGHFG